ncbi:PAR1 protein [Striga asiatica]|uniref:PAR1 protein n=1 Tax=Striga asiatica TaxID=4170 RepID=A0A5A7QMW5_STRAF|nr:PAR1 protein [Striga asiatica]
MAPTTLLVMVLSLAISLQGILGMDINCDTLDEKSCAFAVSSSGRRCVLENRLRLGGTIEYACGTSEIVADKITNWVETDSCISACGLDRRALGISSDSLLDGRFAQSLCSEVCYNNCPNIVDLYFNLAAGEGINGFSSRSSVECVKWENAVSWPSQLGFKVQTIGPSLRLLGQQRKLDLKLKSVITPTPRPRAHEDAKICVGR